MLFFGLFIGCSDKESHTEPEVLEPSTPIQVDTALEPTDEPPSLESNTIGEGELYPEKEESYRNKKRMRIEHIKDSMVLVSGGIEWSINNKDMWENYSATLGVPDFQSRVLEDRTVSVMFQKFLEDAASYTCEEWISQETSGTDRLFFSEIEPGELDAAKIRLNMVALRRQIHGRSSLPDDPIIDALIDLHFTVVQRTGSVERAWITVCVGLFTHPDFYMY